jgi:hypothetical protein
LVEAVLVLESWQGVQAAARQRRRLLSSRLLSSRLLSSRLEAERKGLNARVSTACTLGRAGLI